MVVPPVPVLPPPPTLLLPPPHPAIVPMLTANNKTLIIFRQLRLRLGIPMSRRQTKIDPLPTGKKVLRGKFVALVAAVV
jgi:hypothetical protein